MKTKASLRRAIDALCRRDEALARIEALVGPLRHRRRSPGFVSLVRILVGQQLSTTAATAIFGRLETSSSGLTPEYFLTSSTETLRALGLSMREVRYCRAFGAATAGGRLDLDGLAGLPDAVCIERLKTIPGIGDWTAQIYLLSDLGRPDIWPQGDLGLQAAYHHLVDSASLPSSAELAAIAEAWRPWRSVAAHLLWHYYDCIRKPM